MTKTIISKNCKECEEIFERALNGENIRNQIFCSRKCYREDKRHNFRLNTESIEKMKEIGRKGALSRWEGHIKIKTRKYKYNYQPYKDKYPSGATERKRFTNMRYKTRKRNAEGEHTFEEWLLLKTKYRNMCLCCKRFEPDIKLTEDHIVPLSLGGTDKIENIQPLCQECNTRKSAKHISYLPFKEQSDQKALFN